MTLEEAIEHAEQTAARCDGECADDHWQLADWLRELRRARMELDLLRTLRDEFRADAQKYKAENEKLREMAAQALQTIKHVNVVMAIDYARYSALMSMARELGIEAE